MGGEQPFKLPYNCVSQENPSVDEVAKHTDIVKPEVAKPTAPVAPAPPTVIALPERPNHLSAAGALWYPAAVRPKNAMKTIGKYPKGYPRGAVVHYTAGHDNTKGTYDYGVRQGYTFFVIGSDGTVYQGFPLNEWGWHAGKSSYPGLTGSVSDDLVGIEICNAGTLEKLKDGRFKSWFGKLYEAKDVRYVKASKANQRAGYYHKYTEAQEYSLMALLEWLKTNRPDVFTYDLVVGHDEVAPGRKSDPGGSLSMTMPELRTLLKARNLKKA